MQSLTGNPEMVHWPDQKKAVRGEQCLCQEITRNLWPSWKPSMMVHPMFRQVSRSIGEKSGGIWETSLIGDGNFPGGMEGSEQEKIFVRAEH